MESAQAAARLASSGDDKSAKEALERAERRLQQFSQGRPWHARDVRQAREVVAKAKFSVESSGNRRIIERRGRAMKRAIDRMKA